MTKVQSINKEKIILVTLNIVLLSIIWLSDGNYLDSLKERVDQNSIVLSKDVILEPGKEIIWALNTTEKRELTDIMVLELAAPSLENSGNTHFQLQLDGYVEFNDGRTLTRMIVPSVFGQNSRGFTQKYAEPGRFDSRDNRTKLSSDHFRVGNFVNLFWEPLTIKIKIVDVSDELVGKQLKMSLGSNSNHEVGLLYGLSRMFAYLKISVAVVCLFLLNVIYLKIKRNKSTQSSVGSH